MGPRVNGRLFFCDSDKRFEDRFVCTLSSELSYERRQMLIADVNHMNRDSSLPLWTEVLPF